MTEGTGPLRYMAMVGLVLPLLALPASAEQLWLVIAASASSPAVIANDAARLTPDWPHGLVVQTDDCREAKHMYVFAVAAAPTLEAAQAAQRSASHTVPDAYIKRCNVKAGSLLSVRANAVDPSIAAVPKDAVNWDDADRVSQAWRLPDGQVLLAERHYAKVADDPLEGRRVRVLLAQGVQHKRELREHCFGIQGVVPATGRVAFDCMTEQAADHVLHTTFAYDSLGVQLAEIVHCRSPSFRGHDILECQKETIDPAGKLSLSTTRIRLPK